MEKKKNLTTYESYFSEGPLAEAVAPAAVADALAAAPAVWGQALTSGNAKGVRARSVDRSWPATACGLGRRGIQPSHFTLRALRPPDRRRPRPRRPRILLRLQLPRRHQRRGTWLDPSTKSFLVLGIQCGCSIMNQNAHENIE